VACNQPIVQIKREVDVLCDNIRKNTAFKNENICRKSTRLAYRGRGIVEERRSLNAFTRRSYRFGFGERRGGDI